VKIQGEETVNINGKEYWTIKSFAALSQRTERVVRKLVVDGNRQRKLNAITLNGRVYIEQDELFEFPFTTGGRPAQMGDFVEKFYEEDGELMREEVCVKR
jgi:hypothetical protein